MVSPWSEVEGSESVEDPLAPVFPGSLSLSLSSSMLHLGSGLVLLINLPAPDPFPGDSQVSDRP